MPLNTLEINCNGAFSNIFLITTIIFAICREIDVLMPGYTHMQVKKFAAFLGPVQTSCYCCVKLNINQRPPSPPNKNDFNMTLAGCLNWASV